MLSGILTPNDGHCHLNQTDDTGFVQLLTTMVFIGLNFSRAGYYTMGEQLDYPSVSHISSVAQVHFKNFQRKIKILVKLDSVSQPPRMATSTLSLQSRRTTSRPTRLLQGVKKIFLFTKSFQRHPRPSACRSAGTRRDQHHQCGGGRLRGDHHLHPGGGSATFHFSDAKTEQVINSLGTTHATSPDRLSQSSNILSLVDCKGKRKGGSLAITCES